MSLPKIWLGLAQLLIDAVFEFHGTASALRFVKRYVMDPLGDGLTLLAAFGATNVLSASQHHRVSLLTVLNSFETNIRHLFLVIA